MKRSSINWSRVEAAMARAKRGVSSPEDGALCLEAFNLAPTEYTLRKKIIDKAAHRSMNPLAKAESKK